MFIVDSHCHLDALDYENLHKDIAQYLCVNFHNPMHLNGNGNLR